VVARDGQETGETAGEPTPSLRRAVFGDTSAEKQTQPLPKSQPLPNVRPTGQQHQRNGLRLARRKAM
jgi:hypothetical protein